MSGKIYGAYRSHSEAMEAIRDLKRKGISNQQIAVLADRKERLSLEGKENVEILEMKESSRGEGLLEKIQHFFQLDDNAEMDNRLSMLDVTEEEKNMYLKRIKDGEILVVYQFDSGLGPDQNDSSYQEETRITPPLSNPNTDGL
ncbi:MAG: general stress protein [Bacillus sp. (in: firmicutes)]